MLECGILGVWRKSSKAQSSLSGHFKGIANHYRIAILLLVRKADGYTVEDLTKALDANFKTISQHTRSLVQAGLLNKKYRGRQVLHSLSPYGNYIVRFIENFQTRN